jgi:hypothetical protein
MPSASTTPSSRPYDPHDRGVGRHIAAHAHERLHHAEALDLAVVDAALGSFEQTFSAPSTLSRSRVREPARSGFGAARPPGRRPARLQVSFGQPSCRKSRSSRRHQLAAVRTLQPGSELVKCRCAVASTSRRLARARNASSFSGGTARTCAPAPRTGRSPTAAGPRTSAGRSRSSSAPPLVRPSRRWNCSGRPRRCRSASGTGPRSRASRGIRTSCAG